MNQRPSSPTNTFHLFLAVLLGLNYGDGQICVNPPTVDFFTVQLAIRDQPLFFNFLPKTEENMLLDNVCATFLPLPDDPNTVIEFDSFVFCDGSHYVQSYIETAVAGGTFRGSSPMATFTDFIVGYAGCDTYIGYRCPDFGNTMPPYNFGVSFSCSPIGLSCLKKFNEVITNAGLPQQEMYILPMKLPNRCVTQASCTLPPNPFYNKLGPSVGLAGSLHY